MNGAALLRPLIWRVFDSGHTGGIDTKKIGVSGLSLGGLNTLLVTYHPTLRDPRIKAAAAYINTVGRSVAQVRKDAALRDAIEAFLDGRDWSGQSPRAVRAAVQEFVGSQPALRAALRPASGPGLGWRLRDGAHLVVTIAALATAHATRLLAPSAPGVQQIAYSDVLAIAFDVALVAVIALLAFGRPERILARLRVSPMDAWVGTGLGVAAVGVFTVAGYFLAHAAH